MPSLSALPGRPRAAGRLARSPQLAAALAARLTASGQQAPAFTLRTSPLPPPVPGRAALIRRAAAAASRTRPPTVSPPAAGVVADPRRPARPASLASTPGASRPEHESG